MARYSISATKTSTAAAGWVFQIRQAATTRDLRLIELGLFTTTAAAGTYGLVRSSTVGATFTSLTGIGEDTQSNAAAGVIDTAATTAPVPVSTTAFFRTAVFPATIGSGAIWTFPIGLMLAAGGAFTIYQTTAAAVGLSMYAVWDE